jgi:hypothetical protein
MRQLAFDADAFDLIPDKFNILFIIISTHLFTLLSPFRDFGTIRTSMLRPDFLSLITNFTN